MRLAGVRDPIARACSAWEHRVLLLRQRGPKAISSLTPEVIVDGQVDLAASFARFAHAIVHHTDAFMSDHHSLPQSHVVRPDVIDYNMLIRVDQPGHVQRVADMLRERSG